MKTERRHELQTNDLALWLTNFIEKYRSQAGLVGGLAGLGIIAWLATSYMAKSSERASAGAWSSYFQATEVVGTSEGQFDVVASNYANTAAGQWAKFSSANNLLGQATRLAFSDREEAKAKLKTAKEHFESLSEVTDALLRPRAMLGLAQTLETMGALGDQGAIGDAAKQFEQVIENFPDTAIAKSATEQLERLKKNQNNDWYAWFASQEPAPDPLSQPGLFNNLDALPDDSNVNVPGVGSLIRPDGSESLNPVDLTAPENSTETPDQSVPANNDDLNFSTDDISTDLGDDEPAGADSAPIDSEPDDPDADANVEPDVEAPPDAVESIEDNPDPPSGDN